jgi:short-subunit dehydrogenase
LTPPGPQAALVTGASSGIGEAYARRLAADRHDLVLVARRQERLERLASELEREHGIAAEVLVADLATEAGVAAVERRIDDGLAIDVLVNNAGSGRYGAFAELDRSRLAEILELNVIAVARLTRAVLPQMVERGSGTVINVASLLGFTASIPAQPLPLRATYAATKAFVICLSEVIADEVLSAGVRVQAVCPGIVRTEFHEIAGADPEKPPPFAPMEPAEVVDASLAGVRLGEVLCIPGLADPQEIETLREAEKSLFLSSAPGPRAERYA